MGIFEVVQGNLEGPHRCSGLEPLWVRGALPDKSNGNRVAAQPAGAVPRPPGNDIDAPRDQLDFQPRGFAPRAHIPTQGSWLEALNPGQGPRRWRSSTMTWLLGMLPGSVVEFKLMALIIQM